MCEKDLEHFCMRLAVSSNSGGLFREKACSLHELYLHVNLENKLKQRHQKQESRRVARSSENKEGRWNAMLRARCGAKLKMRH